MKKIVKVIAIICVCLAFFRVVVGNTKEFKSQIILANLGGENGVFADVEMIPCLQRIKYEFTNLKNVLVNPFGGYLEYSFVPYQEGQVYHDTIRSVMGVPIQGVVMTERPQQEFDFLEYIKGMFIQLGEFVKAIGEFLYDVLMDTFNTVKNMIDLFYRLIWT